MSEFDFGANTSVSDLDGVPTKFQSLYIEGKDDDGATVYTINEGVLPLVEAYGGTNKALVAARADKKKASDESATRRVALREFEELVESLGLEVGDDGVGAALKRHIDELASNVKGGEKLKVDLTKIKNDAERRITEAKSASDTEIKERDDALAKHLVSDVATRELSAAEGSIELLLPHIKSACKVFRTENGTYEVRVVDIDGDARSDGAGGWMGVKDLVAELKAKPEFGGAFKSQDKGGSGLAPGATKQVAGTRIKGEGEVKSNVDKISAALQKGLGKRA